MDDSLSFDGRVALVSGAGRGMGREHARMLAARGAKVVVNSRSAAGAEETARSISDAGGLAVVSIGDVCSPETATSAVGAAIEAFGRIDIVVNNAGIARFKAFGEIDNAEYSMMIDTHMGGAWHLSKAAWPHMVAQNYGRIVMISSLAGLYGLESSAHYCAAKAGVFGLAQGLAREGEPLGILVNTINTGAFTDMTSAINDDQEWLAYMEDYMPAAAVAPAVAWLCHEDCSANAGYFSACGKRMSEIFLPETMGFAADDYTLESVRDNFTRVRDRAEFTVHENIQDMITFMMTRLPRARAGSSAAPADQPDVRGEERK